MTPPRLVLRTERWLDAAVSLGAAAVLAALWLGLAYTLVADAALPDRAWVWLRALEPVVQIVVWIAILPISARLPAWTAAWPPFVEGLVIVGLLAWTVAAVVGRRRIVGNPREHG